MDRDDALSEPPFCARCGGTCRCEDWHDDFEEETHFMSKAQKQYNDNTRALFMELAEADQVDEPMFDVEAYAEYNSEDYVPEPDYSKPSCFGRRLGVEACFHGCPASVGCYGDLPDWWAHKHHENI